MCLGTFSRLARSLATIYIYLPPNLSHFQTFCFYFYGLKISTLLSNVKK